MVRKRKSSNKLKKQVLLAALVASSIIMKYVVFLAVFTMAPTIVAFFTDKTRHKNKVLAIGSMNLAGSMPFLLELWKHSNDFMVFGQLVQNPLTYLVAYGAAATGIMINWAAVGAVSTMLFQKGTRRLRRIEVRQKELYERWGEEVAGNIAIDENGRPSGQMKAP